MIAALLLTAATATPTKGLPPAPLDYSAQSMTLEPKADRALLEGDVSFKRTDLHVTGDRADVQFVERLVNGVKQRAIESFVVDGHVHVERPGTAPHAPPRTADGDHAVYQGAEQTIVLTGAYDASAKGPALREGGERMEGDRILLHLDSDEVDVQRPRLFLKRTMAGLPGAKSATEPPQPVYVEAMTLKLDQQRRVARFRDRVVVKRGDLVVKAPRLDARYDDKGELSTLQMRGGVEMTEAEKRAVGKQADYDASSHKFVLTGDPRLYDRGDVLRGDVIVMLLDSNQIDVEKAHGRVRPEQHKDEQAGGGK